MLTIDLLRRYKQQNPVKYAHKYGNRTPEEVMETPTASTPAPVIQSNVVVTGKKELEMEFKDNISGFTTDQAEEKPKRTRKAKELN